MIKFEAASFVYNNSLLIDNCNLHVPHGTKTVLYGPSGAGKSTLLHATLGFVSCDAGKVRVGGMEQNRHNARKIAPLLSWLPQDLSLPYATVREMAYAIFDFKSNRTIVPSEEEVRSLFAELLLDPSLLDRSVSEISGGERQRVLLASVLLLKREILLLDEPTSALDTASVDAVVRVLRARRCTMLAVSHDERFINAFDQKEFIPKL